MVSCEINQAPGRACALDPTEILIGNKPHGDKCSSIAAERTNQQSRTASGQCRLTCQLNSVAVLMYFNLSFWVTNPQRSAVWGAFMRQHADWAVSVGSCGHHFADQCYWVDDGRCQVLLRCCLVSSEGASSHPTGGPEKKVVACSVPAAAVEQPTASCVYRSFSCCDACDLLVRCQRIA